MCDWLNSIGVTGVLLKYRVPKREGRPYGEAPLQDAQRAMGLIRTHAAAWGIDPKRVGVLGFSAGGNLSAALSAAAGKRNYPRVDGADDASCRPDFQVLIYPGYLVVDGGGYWVNPEVAVTPGTPPTFLAMAQDDPVGVENILLGYGLELKKAKGSHGAAPVPEAAAMATACEGRRTSRTTWPDRAADWMKSRGLLENGPGASQAK